jgi:hypothetical protein
MCLRLPGIGGAVINKKPREARACGASFLLEKSRHPGAFLGRWLRCRRQKAWFLPPAASRSYARAGDFEPCAMAPAL